MARSRSSPGAVRGPCGRPSARSSWAGGRGSWASSTPRQTRSLTTAAYRTLDERVELARSLLDAGADIIDIGGESGRDQPSAGGAGGGDRARGSADRARRGASSARSCPSTPTSPPWRTPRSPPARQSSTTSAVYAIRSWRTYAQERAPGSSSCTRVRRPSRSCSTRRSTGCVGADVKRFLRELISAGDGTRRRLRATDARPRPRFREDTRADGRGAARAVRAARARAAGAAGGVAQRLRRSDHGAVRRAHGLRERWPRSEHGVDAGAHVLRVHDVAEVADFLAVRAVLAGEAELDSELSLAVELRREPDRAVPR